MGKVMTKATIAALLAEKFQLKKKTAVQILEEIAALAYSEAKNTFTIPGIGKLVLVERKARMGRNPATGQQIQIPAKTVVKFRVAKACKDAILLQKTEPPQPLQ
jgi:DNA-binding protein HU-beta